MKNSKLTNFLNQKLLYLVSLGRIIFIIFWANAKPLVRERLCNFLQKCKESSKVTPEPNNGPRCTPCFPCPKSEKSLESSNLTKGHFLIFHEWVLRIFPTVHPWLQGILTTMHVCGQGFLTTFYNGFRLWLGWCDVRGQGLNSWSERTCWPKYPLEKMRSFWERSSLYSWFSLS